MVQGQIKLFNKYLLSEWTDFGDRPHLWNYYRSCGLKEGYPATYELLIGLVVNSRDDFIANPNRCLWQPFCCGSLIPVARFLNQQMKVFFGDKRFGYSQLGEAKTDIDNFIVKIDRLKAFV